MTAQSAWIVAMLFAALARHSASFCLSRNFATSSLGSWMRRPTGRAALTQRFRLASTATDLTRERKEELEKQIKAKGDEIRALKKEGADKSTVTPLVEQLLTLKAQLDPSILDKKKKQQSKLQRRKQSKTNQDDTDDDDDESDFITARSVDYSKWYNDLIRVTGLAETSPVRGCMVIKPWGMALWDRIRNELDARIQEHGAENAYFPLLIPKSFLSKEAEHVDGFAKECAVVTHHRLTTSDDDDDGTTYCRP